jgi:hypothetical protein
VKLLDAFRPEGRNRDGRSGMCRICRNGLHRTQDAANKDKRRESKRLWQEAKRGGDISVRKQRTLPFRNFPPCGASKRVPRALHSIRAWVSERVEAGAWQNKAASRLARCLSQMCYDDALVCDEWRLELLYLERGLPHFRLYWNGLVFGVADIFSLEPDLSDSRHAPIVCQKLAAYLVALGWRADHIQMLEGDSITEINANVHHQYRLFKAVVETPKARARAYDLLRESVVV